MFLRDNGFLFCTSMSVPWEIADVDDQSIRYQLALTNGFVTLSFGKEFVSLVDVVDKGRCSCGFGCSGGGLATGQA